MEPEYYGGSYQLLIKQPLPKTNELIDIALCSTDPNEIAAACVFLYTGEQMESIDFRESQITRLEEYYSSIKLNLTAFETKRIETIINESELTDSTNKKPILGKHYTEIEKDYQHYKDIAQRAKQILTQIKYSI